MAAAAESAVAAALSAARAQGVASDDPVVLREAWHVLVHLRPFPLVARVSRASATPGGPKPEDVVHELAVASHAARAGAPVVPPADELDPGPHRHGGHVVTFWRFVEATRELDARAAGRALRAVHEALADYAGALPEAGHPVDTDEMLGALETSEDVEFLRQVAARSPDVVGGQALHGDAHLENCLGSREGPLWHDFETACRGAREYDLAALVLRDLMSGHPPAREALRAYGDHDRELLEALVPVYASWVFVSLLSALPRRPEVEPVVAERVRWLRGYLSR